MINLGRWRVSAVIALGFASAIVGVSYFNILDGMVAGAFAVLIGASLTVPRMERGGGDIFWLASLAGFVLVAALTNLLGNRPPDPWEANMCSDADPDTCPSAEAWP